MATKKKPVKKAAAKAPRPAAKAVKPAAAPAVSPAPAAKSGRKKTLTLIAVALVVLGGLGIQTWMMAARKAAMTFDLMRIGSIMPKGYEDGQIMGALGMGCDSADNLYILDNISPEQPRLQKFGPQGAFVAKYKAKRPLENFVDPRDMAVGKDGLIAVVKRDGSVRLLDKDLKFIKGFETGLGETRSIAIDSKDRIFVASMDANKVVYFDKTGKKLGEFGSPGTNTGDLSNPIRMRFTSGDVLVIIEVIGTGPRFKVFGPDFAVLRTFGITELKWSEASQMGVNADGFAFINDHMGDKGVVVYNVNTGKYVGNTKGTTAGDLFVSPGAVGAGTWGKAAYIGCVSGYFKSLYQGPNKK